MDNDRKNGCSNNKVDLHVIGWKCLLLFFLVVYCVSGIAMGLLASFFLVFRYESHSLSPAIMLYFLLVPTTSVVTSTILGWSSIRKNKKGLVKFFSAFLALTVFLEISGSLWCFGTLKKTQGDILKKMTQKLSMISIDEESENYWNRLQRKFECCGLSGPEDYKFIKNGLPLSCCDNKSNNFCSLIIQEGCSKILMNKVAQELYLIGLMGIIVAVVQVPGIFFAWCFANRISKESN